MSASLLAEPVRRGMAAAEVAPRPRRVVVLASLARSLVIFRGQLLRAMVEAGHDVLALAPEDDPAVAETLARIGVRYRAVPMARVALHPLADLRTVVELLRILRRFGPDVFLGYTMKPIIYGGLAAQLAAVPHRYAMITGLGYVYTDCGAWRAGRRVLQIVSGMLYRRALRGIEAVFVYNPDDEREITSRGIVSPRQRVIRVAGSGINLTHFAAVPLPSGPPVFLLIARLLRDKGLIEYVEAARMLKARHPGVRVQLLGPFDLNPTAIDREQLETWEREGVIEYLGETQDVRPFLAACTVYVLPSYREGVPRTVLEAMATGRAIVTTDAPGCRETVVPDDNGLVVPVRDPLALASAMERFVSEPGLAARMGRRSRQIAAARFDVHKVNRVLLDSMGLL